MARTKKEDSHGFEKAILKVSSLRERKLYGPAAKAAEDPETGIVIKQKPAYFVIKDCATITKKYLFIMCYGSLTDPIGQLKGKVSVEDIEDFVGRSKNKEKLLWVDIKNGWGNWGLPGASLYDVYEAYDCLLYTSPSHET